MKSIVNYQAPNNGKAPGGDNIWLRTLFFNIIKVFKRYNHIFKLPTTIYISRKQTVTI